MMNLEGSDSALKPLKLITCSLKEYVRPVVRPPIVYLSTFG